MVNIILPAATIERARREGQLTFRTLRRGFVRCNQDFDGVMPKFRPNQIPGLINQAFPKHHPIIGSDGKSESDLPRVTRGRRGEGVKCPKCRRKNYYTKIGKKYKCRNKSYCGISFIVVDP